MELGSIIRKRRREKELTQELLAEYLSVSVSAVSQWEADKTAPDLSLIPALCHVLDITADELLGIDRETKEREAKEHLDKAHGLWARGYKKEAYDTLAKGLKRFPDNHQMLYHQMYNAFSLNIDGTLPTEERRGYGDEAIRHGEAILDRCTDDSLRHGALQILCMMLGGRGEKERVRELAAKAANIACSHEFLMRYALKGDEGDLHEKRLRFDLLQFLSREMDKNYILDNGEKTYTAEEIARLRDKVIALFDIMFENGDFYFYHGLLNAVHQKQALWYAEKGEGERVLHHLGHAADHAIGFVRLLEEEGEKKHTSLLFRGLEAGKGISVSDPENSAMSLLRHMEREEYDFVREAAAFEAITERLGACAGKWTVGR